MLRLRADLALTVLVMGLSGCGYRIGQGLASDSVRAEGEGAPKLALRAPLRVAVAPVTVVTADVDLGGEVEQALRKSLPRVSRLEVTETATTTLQVEVSGLQEGLSPWAEPGLRAAEYRVSVRLRASLLGGGLVRWRSPVVTGSSSYLSRPGRMEALDGAGRLAVSRAVDEAVERLMTALVWADPP